MIAEDRDHRDAHGGVELLRQDHGLLAQAVVSKISAEEQHVGVIVDGRKERLKRSVGAFLYVQISGCGQAHRLLTLLGRSVTEQSACRRATSLRESSTSAPTRSICARWPCSRMPASPFSWAVHMP